MKIFNCLKGVRSRFKLRYVNFFLLLSLLWLWLIGFPGVVSAQAVDIPDANLRAAIAGALNKAPGDAITRADMETLDRLWATYRDITDLRGIEFAINLTELYLYGNSISDISPLASLTNLTRLNLQRNSLSDISPLSSLTNLTGLWLLNNSISDISPLSSLTNLTELDLAGNSLSDISPLSSLTNLTRLWLYNNSISDISPLSSLTNLTELDLAGNSLSDISPLSSLTNLTRLWLDNNSLSDISPLSSLTNLTRLWLDNNSVSDISPLSSLTNLTRLQLGRNSLSDISPLSSLTNLTRLWLYNNSLSDISPLSSLTNLTRLDLAGNSLSDIFPLIALTNLTYLYLQNNNISDIETLERLMLQGTVVYFRDNPAFETPGLKIESGWIWLVVPATNVGNGSSAANSGRDFLSEASGGAVTEADVAVNGASVGTQVGNSVWTAAALAATDRDNLNALMRAHNLGPNITYPVAYGVVSIRSETPQQTRVYIGGGPVKVWFNGTLVYRDTDQRSVSNYETAVPVMLNAGENLLFIAAYRPYSWWSQWGAFFGFQDGTDYTVGTPGAGHLDVNGDGQVDVLDLVLVAVFYGMRGDGLPADVNEDGVVNIQDFAAVAAGVDAANLSPQEIEQVLLAALEQAIEIEAVAEAPMRFGTPQHALSGGLVYGNVAAALADARLLAETGDARLSQGAALLKTLLELLTEMRAIPETTALLPNYPNPFNPETWIPYHLAKAANVTLTIYDMQGVAVRQLMLGYQPAGVYRSKHRAAYWNGRNDEGEKVSSGVYFYTLTTGDFTATRKLLIIK